MASWRKAFAVRNPFGPVKTVVMPEAASQSFKRGDAVKLNGSGKVELAKASSATYASALLTSATPILGFAMGAATGSEDKDVIVALADSTNEFGLPVTHLTPAAAVTANTQIGGAYQVANLDISGTVAFGVALDQTATPVAVIQEIDPTFVVGEQYGTVWVKILPAAAMTES